MSSPRVLLRNADLGGRGVTDVRVEDGRIAAIGCPQKAADIDVDCAGGALLPGLHDHHVHLLATAAAAESVPCDVRSRDELGRALRSAEPRAGWLRGVGYDDGTVGDLDRDALDDLRADVPVRVQHRSGALWVLNSAALAALDIADAAPAGVERDGTGSPTGRLWRMDGWLQDRLPTSTPDLAAVSRRLAGFGITGVTDATPQLPAESVQRLADGAIQQRIVLLGDPSGTAPWKIVVADHDLPDIDVLCAEIAEARPRPVALHCVTRVALVLAVTALREHGAVPGDRIEHAAVCPPEIASAVAELGVTVVTQPSLVARRGDAYLDRVDPADIQCLWPFASLIAAGVRVGCSSDAPYGDLDPWRTVAAATHRGAPSGRTVAAAERVSAARALAGFLTRPDAPGGTVRAVHVGAPADLVLLDRPLSAALRAPSAEYVRLTMIAGNIVHGAEQATAA
jgi:predicted amidohydrolase YtcJ